MSTTRLNYDNASYKLKLRRSTDPLKYQLYPGYAENCSECISFFGTRNGREDVSIARSKCEIGFGSLAQVESELKNIVLPADKANERGTNRGYLAHKNKIVHKQNCSPFLEQYDSRFSHPAITYRDLDISNYGFNPHLHFPAIAYTTPDGIRTGVDTRIVAKDTFVIPRQKYWDTGRALPNPYKDSDETCGVCCKKGPNNIECGFCSAGGKSNKTNYRDPGREKK